MFLALVPYHTQLSALYDTRVLKNLIILITLFLFISIFTWYYAVAIIPNNKAMVYNTNIHTAITVSGNQHISTVPVYECISYP